MISAIFIYLISSQHIVLKLIHSSFTSIKFKQTSLNTHQSLKNNGCATALLYSIRLKHRTICLIHLFRNNSVWVIIHRHFSIFNKYNHTIICVKIRITIISRVAMPKASVAKIEVLLSFGWGLSLQTPQDWKNSKPENVGWIK